MDVDEIRSLPALKQIQKIREKIARLKEDLQESEKSIPATIQALASQIGYGYSRSDQENFEKMKRNLLDQLASLVSDPEKGNEVLKGLSILENSMTTAQLVNQEKRDAVIKYLYWHDPEIKVSWLGKAFNLSPQVVVDIAGEYRLSKKCRSCGNHLTVKCRSDLNLIKIMDMCPVCEERERNERNAKHEEESQQRKKRLLELKTMPYAEYLQTPEWLETRAAKLKSAWYKCQVCNTGKPPLNVHHRNYKNRGTEDSRDLIVLCQDCHSLFHLNGKLPQESRNKQEK